MTEFVSGLSIGERIGSGHFGEVFEGQDPIHGKVAVKVLRRAPGSDDDEVWASFKSTHLAEAKFLARASHRNVVQVFHVVEGHGGESVLICMEYCSGGSLQSSYEAGPMCLASVRKIGTDVLMGLGAIHARGMIHRDIKPSNILLNERSVAQISDFGLVTDNLLFGYASQAGYLDHLAYEVWNGQGTSIKSDIWAFGITLYRLIHGQVWYESLPISADSIKFGNYVDSLKWLPHVPKGWRRVVRNMLNDDVELRYQNTEQVLSKIAALPVQPDWTISVSPELVRWERVNKRRRVMVEWHRYSPRKHEWVAWSEPLGEGRKRELSSSQGIVGGAQASRELTRFFES